MARTQIQPKWLEPIGPHNLMEGGIVVFEDFSVTTDADTTATMYLGGMIPWRLINESGGSLTFDLTSSRALDGTDFDIMDEDGVGTPMSAFTVADDDDRQCPTGMTGILWLNIAADSAADHVTLVCKR
jgi:hypothetical protein